MISLKDIEEARDRISHIIRHTPLIKSTTLSKLFKTNVYCKLENFQITGAFKVRGAFNKMLSLSTPEQKQGVVAVSGGNHGIAVACAAKSLQIKALVIMPENTPKNYVDACKTYGAEVLLTPTISEAFEKAKLYQEQGFIFVHPFDDPWIIAGQGTLGLELLSDLPNLTDIIVSIGGGGLIGGVATSLKAQNPKIRIWGVETHGADSMAQALAAGHVITLPAITSIAKTLGAIAVSEKTLALAQKYVEKVTVVSDAEAFSALEFLLERAKVLTEPAASCTLAALNVLKENFTPEQHVVLLLCGGNISLEDLCVLRGEFRAKKEELFH